jgi:hypothetical protein
LYQGRTALRRVYNAQVAANGDGKCFDGSLAVVSGHRQGCCWQVEVWHHQTLVEKTCCGPPIGLSANWSRQVHSRSNAFLVTLFLRQDKNPDQHQTSDDERLETVSWMGSCWQAVFCSVQACQCCGKMLDRAEKFRLLANVFACSFDTVVVTQNTDHVAEVAFFIRVTIKQSYDLVHGNLNVQAQYDGIRILMSRFQFSDVHMQVSFLLKGKNYLRRVVIVEIRSLGDHVMLSSSASLFFDSLVSCGLIHNCAG